MISDVHALVLTYNRRELLLRNVEALRAQTHALKSIIVVDNGSTDGTGDALKALDCSLIRYERIEKNVGAARGFSHALEYAFAQRDVDWVWIMDDDMIPASSALQELAGAYHRNFTSPEQVGFFVSQAVDGEGRANNVPTIDSRPRRLGESAGWGYYLDQGIVSVRCSALNALLMPRSTYETFGNLNPDFVVWGEDSEFTLRITEHRPGFFVGSSKVTHLRGQPGEISIFLENKPDRVPNFYYLYRNELFMRRRFIGMHAYLNGIARAAVEVTRLASAGDWRKAQIALRGTLAGMVFNPKPPAPPAQLH